MVGKQDIPTHKHEAKTAGGTETKMNEEKIHEISLEMRLEVWIDETEEAQPDTPEHRPE